jgi:hypothetical protein
LFYFFRKNKIKFSPNRGVKSAWVPTLREYGSFVGVPIAIGSLRLCLSADRFLYETPTWKSWSFFVFYLKSTGLPPLNIKCRLCFAYSAKASGLLKTLFLTKRGFLF